MVCQKWRQKAKEVFNSASLKFPLYLFTINLLALLLPLSFLLLARLTCAQYLLAMAPHPTTHLSSLFLSLILNANPSLLYVLVFFISTATLFYSLTGKFAVLNKLPRQISRPPLYTAWVFLCTLQVCVGMGIEGSIAIGVGASSFGVERGLWSRLAFFLGLHETMLHWSRVVVKPVVDDTVYGVCREEGWCERVGMAMSLGGLWWWRLRDEVEALVIVPEAKRELLMGVGLDDYAGFCLYYLTVAIGIVKLMRGIVWIGNVLLCNKVRKNSSESFEGEDNV